MKVLNKISKKALLCGVLVGAAGPFIAYVALVFAIFIFNTASLSKGYHTILKVAPVGHVVAVVLFTSLAGYVAGWIAKEYEISHGGLVGVLVIVLVALSPALSPAFQTYPLRVHIAAAFPLSLFGSYLAKSPRLSKQKMLLIPLIAVVAFVLFSILLARSSQRVYLTQRIADMDAKLARNPTDSTALEAKANAYADLGDYDKAIALYSEALAMTTTPAYVLHNRGMAYMSKGKYAKAVADLTQALQMNPNEKAFVAQGYNDRAVVYFRSGQYAQSWQDVEKALELGYQVHPGFLAELEKKRSR